MRHFIRLIVFLLFSTLLNAQEMNISGTVKDETGPLPGVMIVVSGTIKATTTDFDGLYELKVHKGDTLLFSFIGMKTEERIVKDNHFIDVLMVAGPALLEEVVVVGYGISSKLAGSTTGIMIRGTSSMITKKHKNLPKYGTLTAGEINDVKKWSAWKRINKKEYEKRWEFQWNCKVDVVVLDAKNEPFVNVPVKLFDGNNSLVSEVLTDANGMAVLVYKKFSNSHLKNHIAKVYFENKVYGKPLKKKTDNVQFVLPVNSSCEKSIDIMFTVDTTGSMGDEISYLQSELNYILGNLDQRIKEKRVGLVFYRDTTDDYTVRAFDFSSDVSNVQSNLNAQCASGGGDFEEAVEEGLKASINANWNPDAAARLLFLILDAPPHFTQENVRIIKNQIKVAQQKGIKIIPIVASGADKDLEFLMRFFSIATNGTYVFLTDDSGVGNAHLKPTTDAFKVEKLNDLIIRLINQYSNS
ncbi:MAG: hypothetical protein COB60_09510 [Flavobacteriaceae bacterium]|nr:MAG: hypothetical protein COB60_09510 [Flavobacteriaceae bacterium]